MQKRLLAVLLLCATGVCQHKPEQDFVKHLRDATAKKGLHWEIVCADYLDNPEKAFFAEAQYPTDTGGYIEDGGKPFWAEFGRTQREAAENLVQSLKGNPIPRDHRPQETGRKKHCPDPITGGPEMQR